MTLIPVVLRLVLAVAATPAAAAVPSAVAADVLAASGPNTAEADLAAALETLRAQRPVAREAGPVLVALLSERSTLYQGRGSREVARLRAFLLSTLSEIGPPPEALPVILAELAHGHQPALRAAAARAAGALGPEGAAAVPFLVRVLEPATHDDQVSLETYFPGEPPRDPTGARIEAVRALARIGPAAREAVPALAEIAAAPPGSFYARVSGLQEEVRRALALISAAPAAGAPCHHGHHEAGVVSAWQSPGARRASPLTSLTARDQEGRSLPLGHLEGQPLALAFFYTRCDNPDKCPLTVARLSSLQSALGKAGLADRVRLAAVTLDPELDTPGELKRFGEVLGMRQGHQAMLLQMARADLDRLLNDLQVAVSYGADRVSVHGVQLYLFDRRGRYVRDYHSVAWDEAEVVADLGRLAGE